MVSANTVPRGKSQQLSDRAGATREQQDNVTALVKELQGAELAEPTKDVVLIST